MRSEKSVIDVNDINNLVEWWEHVATARMYFREVADKAQALLGELDEYQRSQVLRFIQQLEYAIATLWVCCGPKYWAGELPNPTTASVRLQWCQEQQRQIRVAALCDCSIQLYTREAERTARLFTEAILGPSANFYFRIGEKSLAVQKWPKLSEALLENVLLVREKGWWTAKDPVAVAAAIARRKVWQEATDEAPLVEKGHEGEDALECLSPEDIIPEAPSEYSISEAIEREPLLLAYIQHPRARVALFKRDTGGDIDLMPQRSHNEQTVRPGIPLPQYTENQRKNKSKEKKMTFEKSLLDIAKGELVAADRSSIEMLVRKKAAQLAVKKGISLDTAEAKVWKKFEAAQELYDRLPAPDAQAAAEVSKASSDLVPITKAERIMEARAKKLQKAHPGMSYPKAVSQVLCDDPKLYDQYQQEIGKSSMKAKDDPGTTDVDAVADEDEDDEEDDDDDTAGADGEGSRRLARKSGSVCSKCGCQDQRGSKLLCQVR